MYVRVVRAHTHETTRIRARLKLIFTDLFAQKTRGSFRGDTAHRASLNVTDIDARDITTENR